MKKKRQAREASKSAASTVDATAATSPAPATAPRSPRMAPLERGAKAPTSLLDTIEPNTSPGELVRILATILVFPTVVSLIVKYLVMPYLF